MLGAVPLAGCAPDQPAARVSTAQAAYHGTEVRGMWTLPQGRLTGTDGRPVELRQAERPISVVFFGYTHCPDVCTGVLTDLAAALGRMDPATREKIAVTLVTTDPARDTPAVLKDYLGRIDPTFRGLTGDLGEISRLAQQVGVNIESATRLPSGGYEVTHGTQLIAFGPDQTSRVLWTPGSQIGDLKQDLEKVVAQG